MKLENNTEEREVHFITVTDLKADRKKVLKMVNDGVLVIVRTEYGDMKLEKVRYS